MTSASLTAPWKAIVRKGKGLSPCTLVCSHFNEVKAYLKDRKVNVVKYQPKAKIVRPTAITQRDIYINNILEELRVAYPLKSETELL